MSLRDTIAASLNAPHEYFQVAPRRRLTATASNSAAITAGSTGILEVAISFSETLNIDDGDWFESLTMRIVCNSGQAATVAISSADSILLDNSGTVIFPLGLLATTTNSMTTTATTPAELACEFYPRLNPLLYFDVQVLDANFANPLQWQVRLLLSVTGTTMPINSISVTSWLIYRHLYGIGDG